jgi:uncharacterized protein
MAWLLRDGEVLASAEVAASGRTRRRGLLGRDCIGGAFVISPCRQVHTFGMRFPIDVIWCDGDGRILRAATLRPWRLSRPVLRARMVIEAEQDAAARWGLVPGETLEVVDVGEPRSA